MNSVHYRLRQRGEQKGDAQSILTKLYVDGKWNGETCVLFAVGKVYPRRDLGVPSVHSQMALIKSIELVPVDEYSVAPNESDARLQTTYDDILFWRIEYEDV